MNIRADGNIGIGTTNPSANLDVVGTGIISSNLTVSGTLQNPNHIGVSNIVYNDVSLGEKLISWERAQSKYYGLGITGGTIYMHGDSLGNVSIGNGSSISSYTEAATWFCDIRKWRYLYIEKFSCKWKFNY